MSNRARLVLGLVGVLLFAALAAYYLFAASGHPHVKHTLLFLGLTALSGLFAWFSMPPREPGLRE